MTGESKRGKTVFRNDTGGIMKKVDKRNYVNVMEEAKRSRIMRRAGDTLTMLIW